MEDTTAYKRTKDEIRKRTHDLEELVGKRTSGLTIANKQLQQEITEHKQTEQALRESENKFRTLFNSTNDAIFMHDLDGRFLEVNKIACERLGYSWNELLQMTTIDINASEYAARISELIKEIREKEHVIFETVHVRKDGSTIPIELSSRIIDYHGKKAILGIARDITDRKQAEENLKKYIEELKQSNELKDLFTDIMRHDLLNPASVVKGFTDVLLDMEEGEKKIQAIETIKRNNEKLINMLESAAKFSKMKSVEELEFEKMDLGLIFKEVVGNFKSQLEEKQMILEFAAEGTYPSSVNKVIEDVFSNLLSNAIKYSPKESRIIIDIIDAGEEWKVTVTDFGEGIADEDKPQVFDRFKRVGKGGVKGTGLGLAIVKRIIDLHGGRVGVEDNPAGQGSVFWVTVRKA
jgi:PAS domain S-box-containing protein